MKNKQAIFFTRCLLRWNETENNRSLPWKNETDPYKIWLSEIILQQTRALQGLPYYNKFTVTYPTVTDLASAKDEEVFRIWQGLGYYNRCKNMLATARIIATDLNGVFPDTYEGIRALKGIGPYTAAAIASFAFGLPCAVVDGNVYRVLSRYFGIDTPFDTTAGRKQFADIAQELIDSKQSASYNQAIMDLGATVCTPRNALCSECPLQQNCMAFHHDLVNVLPVRSKKTKVATRYFHYLILVWKDSIWLRRRGANDIWQNLNEPFLIEAGEALDEATLTGLEQFKNINLTFSAMAFSGAGTQRLTHRIIQSSFYTIQLLKKPLNLPVDGSWIPISELNKSAFPKTVLTFLKNNYYF